MLRTNTNNFGGFTVVDLLEIVAQFALRCIAGLIERGAQSVEVRDDVYWRFAKILDAEDRKMVYMDPRAKNYYRNEQVDRASTGRSTSAECIAGCTTRPAPAPVPAMTR